MAQKVSTATCSDISLAARLSGSIRLSCTPGTSRGDPSSTFPPVCCRKAQSHPSRKRCECYVAVTAPELGCTGNRLPCGRAPEAARTSARARMASMSSSSSWCCFASFVWSSSCARVETRLAARAGSARQCRGKEAPSLLHTTELTQTAAPCLPARWMHTVPTAGHQSRHAGRRQPPSMTFAWLQSNVHP
jgi:hypothetical protein